MPKSTPILGISLEGFQVFSEKTYIPLDRLTLIFGPNSAGKSAIQDALDLCTKLQLINPSSELGILGVSGEARTLLKRHWRRSSEGGDLANKFCISVKYAMEDDLYSLNSRIDNGQAASYYESPILLESSWTFHLTKDNDIPYYGNFEFLIQSELFVRTNLEYTNDFCVNTSHSLFQNIPLKVDLAKIARLYPKEVTFQDGLFTVLRGITGFQCSGIGSEDKRGRWLGYFPPRSSVEPRKNYDLLSSCVAELGHIVGNILYLCYDYTDLQSHLVSASRTVPSREELTFQLRPPIGQIRYDFPQWDFPSGNPSFELLARSLAGFFYANDKDLGRRVNAAFSDHLFLEQGYQIDYKCMVTLSDANSKAIRKLFEKYFEDGEDEIESVNVELKPDNFGLLVELYLRDGKGRKLLIHDVGTGIGYVLPVLCAIFQSGYSPDNHDFCFIQQPELHLHPALQAALGDVVLEASNAGKQIIIETHSEHMLLRVLKRIRQTHLQATIAPELQINADDVCVLYFNPMPNGTTTVSRLRISEDGEFMDRWPRGFFGERDLELFDE